MIDICCYMCLYGQPFAVSTGISVRDEDIRVNETSHLLALQSHFKQNNPKYEPRLDSAALMAKSLYLYLPLYVGHSGSYNITKVQPSTGISRTLSHESRTKLFSDMLVRDLATL